MKDETETSPHVAWQLTDSGSYIWDSVPFILDREKIARQLRIKAESPMLLDLYDQLGAAEQIARPRAVVKPVYISVTGNDSVIMDGVEFSSRILSVNLQAVHRVFAYVVTAGQEINSWAEGIGDILFQYWADRIQQAVLESARIELKHAVQMVYRLNQISTMSPGRLADWPIEQQKPLFSLFNGSELQIGVQLTESYLMLPSKTVSGIIYTSDTDFESCQLCPRPKCEGRKAAHQPCLAAERYFPSETH